MTKEDTLKIFQKIPSIGKACSLDLWNLGFRSIDELRNQDPYLLYNKLNVLSGVKHDICMLYTLRCAFYYATEKNPGHEKLNWWYWKDKTYNENIKIRVGKLSK